MRSNTIQPSLFHEPVAPVHHFDYAKNNLLKVNGKSLDERSAGKFYTPLSIAFPMINQVIESGGFRSGSHIRIIDPFCGDGRLIVWTLEQLQDYDLSVEVHLWEFDRDALKQAVNSLVELKKIYGDRLKVVTMQVDSFDEFFNKGEDVFDIVVTNPPWEVVKPDPTELSGFSSDAERDKYVSGLKVFSERLRQDYPISSPAKTYGGWGVNLARTGTELAFRLVKQNGFVGIVSPASLLADQNSGELRAWLFDNFTVSHLNVFPAELRLFDKVDQSSVTIVAQKCEHRGTLTVQNFGKETDSVVQITNLHSLLKATNYKFPLSAAVGNEQLDLLSKFSDFEKLSDCGELGVWIGRELDETGYRGWTSNRGRYRFIKGRNVSRFSHKESQMYVDESVINKIPKTVFQKKIVWRDVSRPSQKRRLIPTLLPSGYVAGNSLGVLSLDEGVADEKLFVLLGIISSLAFEFQVRANLATSHVSSGVVRNMRVPKVEKSQERLLAHLVERRLNGFDTEHAIEVLVAKLYGFSRQDFEHLLKAFPKLTESEKDELLDNNNW